MILTPESELQLTKNRSIFLAGAIDLGKAVDWQSEIGQLLSDNGWMVFNPRKADWVEENGALVRQIGWELKRLDAADYVLFYFPATSLAPISLLELGLVLGQGKPVIVCCEPGYYRHTNIHITFTRFTRAKSATSLFLTSYEDLKALCAASQGTRAWEF